MPPLLIIILMIALGGALALLLTTGRRSRSKSGMKSAKRGHVKWAPVVMGKEAERSPDPWTVQLTGSLIQPLQAELKRNSFDQSEVIDDDFVDPWQDEFIGEPATVRVPDSRNFQVAPVWDPVAPPAPKSRALAKGKELTARSGKKLRLKHKQKLRLDNPFDQSSKSSTKKKTKPRRTPYRLYQGEKILLEAPFHIAFVCEGVLFLTSDRLMASYRRTIIDLLPPRIVRRTRRHRLRLDRLQHVDLIETRRPLFLFLGLTTFWWYPWGMLLALGNLSAYFFLTRTEILVISNQDQHRTYPLPPRHLNRFFTTIEESLRRSRDQLKKEIAKKSASVHNKRPAANRGS